MVFLRAVVMFAAAASAAAFSPSRARSTRCECGSRPLCAPPSSVRTPGRLHSEANSDSNEFDDFADFSSTQLTSSDDAANDDESFLSSLQSRVQEVQDQSNKLPLMILDTLLPRQILQIQIQHETLKSLMKHRVAQETPTLGMLGMAKLSTGQTVPLKTGVEVQIVQMEKAVDEPPAGTSTYGDAGEAWDISLRAGRRFVIEGDVEKTEEGWTEAQVKFLDSRAEEENEVAQFSKPSMEDPSGLSTTGDRLSVARAISKSKQFTEPNMNMKNSVSLIDRWIELAKENERHPGQIEALLSQLGDIPPEHEPTERALWVGALINPLPSMGVAMEIRPALLVSKRAEERVQVALDGIMKSIRHMDGSARMW
mmetsp:Transcript_11282/g.24431  ORF Transcript_11282/g.24431 Transcript_11282/m.24431 type:complete len:368 (+) Transcript_11282:158-1261(+)|eukprot:CAMPEP_0172529290 /NCGR_PEP_ID=MMETSP1067-20121228/3409_1 /TAXON_ID=265564 ORGANISM="Thalassiosira punctigera, Strain Tpunct2005C2" /NCGR_SAMPLE_ID=MMETSP1067 /ASSEMBLY_ACC=CAM_ASM_000444 /LENGTH=367 /DNA_ID=CAMNT_0013313321 /DNA_START=158 /DNA_END=1261 /DNA_ORIENTATION=+